MALANAGDIVITTGLDNSKLSKDLDKLEKDLYNKQIDLNIINIDYESAKRQLENINKDLEFNLKREEEIKNKIQEQKEIRDELIAQNGNQLKIFQVGETIDKLNEELATYQDETIKILDNWNKQNDVLEKIELKIEKQNNDIQDTEYKIENVKNEMINASNIDLSKNINKANNTLNKIAKNVKNLGLRLLGINSLYSMISSSVNRVQQSNPQFASFIQQMENMLDFVVNQILTEIQPFLDQLLPLMEELIVSVYELIQGLKEILGPVLDAIIVKIKMIVRGFGWFVNALLKILGVDVSSQTIEFANNLSNAVKSVKETNKQVAKLRKQLLGFDEMNILNSDTGTIGALGSIGNAKETGKEIGDGIADGIGASLGTGVNWVSDSFSKQLTEEFKDEIDTMNDIVKKAIAQGKIKEVNGMVQITTEYGQVIEMTKETYDEMLQHIVYGIPYTQRAIEIWKSIREKVIPEHQKRVNKSFKKAGQQSAKTSLNTLYDMRDGWEKHTSEISNLIGQIHEAVEDGNYKIEKDYVDLQLASGDTVRITKTQFKDLSNSLKIISNDTTKTIVGDATETSETIKTGVDAVGFKVDETTNDIGANLGSLEGVAINSAQGAVTGITTTFDNMNDPNVDVNVQQDSKNNSSKVINDTNKTIKDYNNTNPQVNVNVKPKLQEFKDKLIALLESLNLTGIFGQISQAVITRIRNLAKGGIISYPMLARGGIINRPGRGVPLAVGGIAGERGKEAVVPLTDTQQMEYLGREIAKHIVVNLTNVTELDGRQIARSITKVMQDTQFASNGGVI